MRNACFVSDVFMKANPTRPSFLLFPLVGMLFPLFLLFPFNHKGFANESNPRYLGNVAPGISLLIRGGSAEGSAALPHWHEALSSALLRVSGSRFFQERLPKSFGVIVDEHWSTSEGYFSPKIKTPDGAPAILLSEPAIREPSAQASLLVHELTHLVHFSRRPHEEPWIQEGVALLAETVVTKSFNRALLLGFDAPETSLTEGFDFQHRSIEGRDRTLAKHGHVLQYFYYIYNLCGKDELLNELIESDSKRSGREFLDEILRLASQKRALDPVCASFEKSFLAFENARFFPKASPPSARLLPSFLKARIRPAPLTEAMPPFSAQAVRMREGAASCESGFQEVDPETCFRIRLE